MEMISFDVTNEIISIKLQGNLNFFSCITFRPLYMYIMKNNLIVQVINKTILNSLHASLFA